MTIDLNLVPVFLAVAEERNFRSAADRLGVTRSAVSQAIRRLEDICGIALVSRTTRSVRLTEAGNRFREMLVFRHAILGLTHMWNGPVSKALQHESPSDGAVICPACQRGH